MRLVSFLLTVSLALSIAGCARGLRDSLDATSNGTGQNPSNPQPTPTPTPMPTPTPTPTPQPAPAPTLTFAAQPASVAQGGTVTLTWSSTNATSVTIDNGIGAVATSGSMQITIKSSTTFTATATGQSGSVQQQATVTVLPQPAIDASVCPTADQPCNGGTSTLIRSGGTAVISWQTTNANSVKIDQMTDQQFGPEGTYTTPALTQTTAYNLTATGDGGTASAQVTVNVTAMVPEHKHVALIVEENHSYSQVIGNSGMPFLNQLAQQGALATGYYANIHGSLRDYFELTAGQFLVSSGDYNGYITADNIAAHLIDKGKTWKSYAEALPYAGYTGYNVYPYEKDHNPFAYFTDLAYDPSQAANIVPFSQLAADMQQDNLPNLIYIAPDAQHDAHDCPTKASCTDQDKLAAADQWLKTNVEPLLENDDFKNNGLLLITFDESVTGDNENGGGHVILIAVGPKVRSGYRSQKFYQHQNAVRSMCEALDVQQCPGDAGNANSMLDLFVP